MSLSSWDDYPVHQTAEYIRHPATSDRNFYDRYYFNLHGSTDEVMTIFGLGQYPNLGVTDAFIAVGTKDKHHVVRASRPLQDRSDLKVGPISIEILDPLKSLRVKCEPNEWGVDLDVTWTASHHPLEEPRQYLRREGKVVFDTMRFAQLGRWEGHLHTPNQSWDISPESWGGSRDRSWGVRPVGEKESDGIRQNVSVMEGLWNYYPVDFEDHAIIYMLQETNEGVRELEEAVRVWHDPGRPSEWLGRPEYEHELVPGTRMLSGSVIHFPDAKISMKCTPLLANYVAMGTGYGIEEDWRHGMYQGPDLVVQGLINDVSSISGIGQYGIVDHVGRFEYDDYVGYGLYEHGFWGRFEKFGLTDRASTFPTD
tara:strand:- start:93 stop:1196 length:1104 start_codon:yes stop_codon:yes gene_type:complete